MYRTNCSSDLIEMMIISLIICYYLPNLESSSASVKAILMYQEYLWSLNNKIVSQKSKHLDVMRQSQCVIYYAVFQVSYTAHFVTINVFNQDSGVLLRRLRHHLLTELYGPVFFNQGVAITLTRGHLIGGPLSNLPYIIPILGVMTLKRLRNTDIAHKTVITHSGGSIRNLNNLKKLYLSIYITRAVKTKYLKNKNVHSTTPLKAYNLFSAERCIQQEINWHINAEQCNQLVTMEILSQNVLTTVRMKEIFLFRNIWSWFDGRKIMAMKKSLMIFLILKDGTRSHASVPCGHWVLCNDCANQLVNNHCPICNGESNGVICIRQ
ncbi:hypothetical protein AGLY_007643 [Aphis glycines]|uniref:Uncharacterized protein n=1 Tax=Aphis glycines TaxID=307491 RepID=A0A6G0TML5_APHGL|nr:hypothetical protein AGLY_007643 [Aphis glycines]